MKVSTKYIALKTKGNAHIIDITGQVNKALSETDMQDGTVTVFVQGSTGGLTTVEYESGLIKDLKDLFERIAPSDVSYAHDATWGDANGYSHIRASTIGASLTVPFVKGELTLGTWQQIIFIDFDNRPRSRKLIAQFIGK
ncbi:MAG: YjbQ family protein [Candidatus Omnitrophota bacterium]|nr:MAG: YjbQ family protein [Candidatus Omnitrophota bacterium]